MKARYTLDQKLAFAKKMRRKPTYAEFLLWQQLEGKQLGFVFQRQKLICGYIADFWCPAARVVIELDGMHHSFAEKKAEDDKRELAMDANGILTLRFSNAEIEDSIRVVLLRIKRHCAERSQLRQALKGFGSTQEVTKSEVVIGEPGTLQKSSSTTVNRTEMSLPACQNSAGEPMTLVEAEALSKKFRLLIKKCAFPEVDTRPIEERAWEQRLRLKTIMEAEERQRNKTA